MQLGMSEVGGGYGAERSPPPGIQAQRPAPAHRTHDTTDQWRDLRRWRGRSATYFLLLVGGWGWKRSGAESPTGNPSPAPIAIAPHASHARHDRSMARWISVARAKVGGRDFSPPDSRNVAPSRARPFVHFESGITMVFVTTRCRMLESRYKNKGLVNYCQF